MLLDVLTEANEILSNRSSRGGCLEPSRGGVSDLYPAHLFPASYTTASRNLRRLAALANRPYDVDYVKIEHGLIRITIVDV